MTGSVTLFLGSMKSNKSSALMDIIDKAKYRKKKCILIRPQADTREFVSRKGDEEVEILITDKLTNEGIPSKLQNYDIICIDEGQFISDLNYVHFLALKNIEIYIAALNGDAEMKPWTAISETLPFVDKIKRFSGICEDCGTNTSTFSFYTAIKTEQIVIGNGEYKIYCRECWQKHYNEKMGIATK